MTPCVSVHVDEPKGDILVFCIGQPRLFCGGNGQAVQAATCPHPPLVVSQVHVDEPKGDILVFLTGQEEIDSLSKLLQERSAQLAEGGRDGQELMVLPIYAALPPDQQVKVRPGSTGGGGLG